MHILLGTDPECFILDNSDKYISSHNLIPGTKEQPFPVPKGAIQVDGVAAEFNIEPCQHVDEFTKNIRTVMSALEDHLKGINPDYHLSTVPTAYFDKEYFDNLPDEVKVLGCTPDYDAYTGEENDPPQTTEPFRTGAGHIHIGWGSNFSVADEKHLKNCRELVKELDCTLYPSSLLWDNDTKRRTLYGKMGSFRPKSYGMEYRPLSNVWLKDKKTQEFVFNTTKHVANLYFTTGTRVAEDKVAQKYIEDSLLDRTISPNGLKHYLKYLGGSYALPVYSEV